MAGGLRPGYRREPVHRRAIARPVCMRPQWPSTCSEHGRCGCGDTVVIRRRRAGGANAVLPHLRQHGAEVPGSSAWPERGLDGLTNASPGTASCRSSVANESLASGCSARAETSTVGCDARGAVRATRTRTATSPARLPRATTTSSFNRAVGERPAEVPPKIESVGHGLTTRMRASGLQRKRRNADEG